MVGGRTKALSVGKIALFVAVLERSTNRDMDWPDSKELVTIFH